MIVKPKRKVLRRVVRKPKRVVRRAVKKPVAPKRIVRKVVRRTVAPKRIVRRTVAPKRIVRKVVRRTVAPVRRMPVKAPPKQRVLKKIVKKVTHSELEKIFKTILEPNRKSSIGCQEKFTAKYMNRPGPPFPANSPSCRGTIKIGNDGKYYLSTVASNGIYRWKKM